MESENFSSRRWFLKFVGRIGLGFVTATALKGAVGEPQTVESQRELELQSLEWYRKWIEEGRNVRLVNDQETLGELANAQLVDVNLTQGLDVSARPLHYTRQVPHLIQNFQNDSLVEQAWVAPMAEGWVVTVCRYANLADVDSRYKYLQQKTVKPLDYPNLLEDWSNKSTVTLSKTVGELEIAWSVVNTGHQSRPVLQGGRVERGDYTLSITSKKTGEKIVAIGFAGRLIEPGLDVQHALKNIGLQSLKSYSDLEAGTSTAYFNFGSLHLPGVFPLEFSSDLLDPLDEKQITVLITAIVAYVDTTITPQVVITAVSTTND